MGAFNLSDTMQLFLLRRSWRYSRAVDVMLHERKSALRIPVIHRRGMHLVGPADRDLSAALRQVIAEKRATVLLRLLSERARSQGPSR